MGSIKLGEVEVVVEIDRSDNLMILSIHCGPVNIQAALEHEDYKLLVDEMTRAQIRLEEFGQP